nr:immunoglobulin light chain junction region [Macaca mulatta]MOX77240.1 immunoglobulin light chain junction region [Macaca mulatta]
DYYCDSWDSDTHVLF